MACAFAVGMALLVVLMDVGLMAYHGDPEGAQLGSLGLVAGATLGFFIGYFIAQQRRVRWVFLGASIGAFIGGFVGGYAAPIIVSVAQRLHIAPPVADPADGQALALISLLFTVAGLALGWVFAELRMRLRKRDSSNTASETRA